MHQKGPQSKYGLILYSLSDTCNSVMLVRVSESIFWSSDTHVEYVVSIYRYLRAVLQPRAMTVFSKWQKGNVSVFLALSEVHC